MLCKFPKKMNSLQLPVCTMQHNINNKKANAETKEKKKETMGLSIIKHLQMYLDKDEQR